MLAAGRDGAGGAAENGGAGPGHGSANGGGRGQDAPNGAALPRDGLHALGERCASPGKALDVQSTGHFGAAAVAGDEDGNGFIIAWTLRK